MERKQDGTCFFCGVGVWADSSYTLWFNDTKKYFCDLACLNAHVDYKWREHIRPIINEWGNRHNGL